MTEPQTKRRTTSGAEPALLTPQQRRRKLIDLLALAAFHVPPAITIPGNSMIGETASLATETPTKPLDVSRDIALSVNTESHDTRTQR
jgi:hypothetical protein